MKGITIKTAAQLCGGRLINAPEQDSELNKIIIDSRRTERGDLFAAFRGENSDGHDYIAAAFEKGAACCLASRVPEGESRPLILCEDVEKAMELICAGYRKTLSLPVIGVTGSVGKTSAKEMLSAVLSRRFNVLKTEGNFNNTLGVPLTISRIRPEHQAAVVELGINGFNEMCRLGNMCRPDIALYTIIGNAHLEFLHDRRGVLKAKTELLDYLPEDGIIVINGDDDMLRSIDRPQRLMSFGLGSGCQVRAEDIVKGPDYTDCRIVYKDRAIPVHVPAFGEHMVYAALEGAAIGFLMGLEDEEIRQGIADYKTVGRRAALTDTGKILLVDDAYNANPDSVRCGIDSIAHLPGRKVCILGDMLELGEDSERQHAEIGAYALSRGVELIIASGELSRCTAQAAGDRGRYFESKAQLMEALPELIRPGDVCLVKASMRSHFEDISEMLKKL